MGPRGVGDQQEGAQKKLEIQVALRPSQVHKTRGSLALALALLQTSQVIFPRGAPHLLHTPVTEHDSEASIIQDLRGAKIKETKAGLALGLPVSWTVRLAKGIWNPFLPLAQFAVTSFRVHELIPGISCLSGSSMWTASH